ncbi:hypothetical protein BN871_LF_00020 [Paenibacillus sp. P22]|nr:hypothetical protein BN871_LF_00020 [Paenibacillus sp. P22]
MRQSRNASSAAAAASSTSARPDIGTTASTSPVAGFRTSACPVPTAASFHEPPIQLPSLRGPADVSVISASSSQMRQLAVCFRPPVAIKLPRLPSLADHRAVQLPDDGLVPVPAAFRHNPAAGVDQIGLAVELSHVPGSFRPYPVDRGHVVAVGDCMGRLLQLPQVLRRAGHRRRRIEDNLRPAKAEHPRSLRKMPVVANIDAYFSIGRVEDGIAEIPGLEIILLPEAAASPARSDLGNMMLAVFAQHRSVGIDDRRRIVIAGDAFPLIDGQDKHDAKLPCKLREHLHGRPGRDLLCRPVPFGNLLRAEIRTEKNFLQTDDPGSAPGRFADEPDMLVDRGGLVDRDVLIAVHFMPCLDQADFDRIHYPHAPASRLFGRHAVDFRRIGGSRIRRLLDDAELQRDLRGLPESLLVDHAELADIEAVRSNQLRNLLHHLQLMIARCARRIR